MSKRAKKKGSTSPEKTKQTLESLTEDRLRNSGVIPVFEAIGFRYVFHHHGGALEQGKDITMWKPGDLEERVNYAVVVKRGDVTGKAAGKQGAGEVETQIRQCFGSPFKDPITSEDQDVDRCWVVASGKISKEALNAIQVSLKGTNYRSVTRFIDGKQLAKLIRQHMPGKTLWDQVEDVRNT